MPDLRSELMKLDNLQFDDDVQSTPIIDKAEQKRLKQREYNARYIAKKKLLAAGKPPTTKAKVKPKPVVTGKSDASIVISQMPVMLAREVYLELKKVFES
jgi:hypothetical protein